ncbi:uracil-DNA glycosylase [Aquipuribacter hungaricus]|uniref:Type-5 uracil-DNA glycosylase n=1 Tax=Aquipuribacter hungaricus TaxID=545624 RepID=A0ABV7WD97_9MICO
MERGPLSTGTGPSADPGAGASVGPSAGSNIGPSAGTTTGQPAVPVAGALAELAEQVSGCRACPRLVAWREEVARTRRASYATQEYWGRPVPGFGDPEAELLVLGLAPAAHGANRTGRVFTGDRSGDFLFAAMHRVGLANQAHSESVDDGLRLHRTWVSASVRCAPPANRPTPQERDTCAPWLDREIDLLAPLLRSVVVLGGFGWGVGMTALARAGWVVPAPKPVFGHGAEVVLQPRGPSRRPLRVLGSYHVSQQNTFTGRLTPAMLDDVLRRAVED